MKFDKGMTSVGTSLLILQLLEKTDMYGYMIISELKQKSNNVFELQEGTLYPILHGMQKDGYIDAYDLNAENGRARKYYHITQRGKKQLAAKKKEWKIFSSAMENMMGGNA
ncbi:MAG: helix-turn-helix transcriptional regulator [Christensenella sp.]